MQTSFYVYDVTSNARTFLGERPTFDEAEAFGRWHAARRPIRVRIIREETTKRTRHNEEMAVVSRDPLGRLWTDLTWLGAALV